MADTATTKGQKPHSFTSPSIDNAKEREFAELLRRVCEKDAEREHVEPCDERCDEPCAATLDAKDALAALWFSLDEIRTVAGCIPLVLEHEGAALRAERVDGLARAVGVLVTSAIELHARAERALGVT